jgi:hypothetical protein
MVSLSDLENVDDDSLLRFGEPLETVWPSNVTLHFDPERKKAIVQTDTLYNLKGIVVASEKLVALLKAHKVPYLEYLPLTVLDHKNKPVPGYQLVHPVNPVACLDIKASKGKKSKFVPGRVDEIKTLVLDETKIPADRTLFRVAEYPWAIVAHSSLADVISKAGILGIYWLEPSKFPE